MELVGYGNSPLIAVGVCCTSDGGWMVCMYFIAVGGKGSCVDALGMTLHLNFYLECGFTISTRERVEFKCGGV